MLFAKPMADENRITPITTSVLSVVTSTQSADSSSHTARVLIRPRLRSHASPPEPVALSAPSWVLVTVGDGTSFIDRREGARALYALERARSLPT